MFSKFSQKNKPLFIKSEISDRRGKYWHEGKLILSAQMTWWKQRAKSHTWCNEEFLCSSEGVLALDCVSLYYFWEVWLLFHAALFTFPAPVVEIALKQVIIISEYLTSINQWWAWCWVHSVLKNDGGSCCTRNSITEGAVLSFLSFFPPTALFRNNWFGVCLEHGCTSQWPFLISLNPSCNCVGCWRLFLPLQWTTSENQLKSW